MTDLHTLLDVASRPPADGRDPSRDSSHDLEIELRLGRRALRRRRISTAGGGVAAAGLVVGALVSGAALLGDVGSGATGLAPAAGVTPSGPPPGSSSPPVTTSPPATITYDPVALVPVPAKAGPFRFAKTPSGWTAGPSLAVTGNLVPPSGPVSSDPYDSAGKVTVTLDRGHGAYSDTSGGVTRLGIPYTHRGERVTLAVQVPESLLSLEDIHDLASSISVDANAVIAPG